MTVVNRSYLLAAKPIVDMVDHKVMHHGVTYGLGEGGYDIRIKQEVFFQPNKHIRFHMDCRVTAPGESPVVERTTRFALASAVEEFRMPSDLLGIVHDKSTWARRGLSVFNTVIEPGWKGFLTLELVYHGKEELIIPAGSGIAQVVFHEVKENAEYVGKYQSQPDRPVGPIESE